MKPSVETILALAEEARRSPHARRVLFDALAERYGAAFESVVRRAQGVADRKAAPVAVVLYPDELNESESPRWWPIRGVWWTAVTNLRSLRRQQAFHRQAVVVVVLRPAGRRASDA